jgi:predicted ATP-binding protein involved in virulence
LFNYDISLQNPEVILSRRTPGFRKELENKLLEIMMLDPNEHKIEYTRKGLQIRGPWGIMPFEVLSDGYRSVAQLLVDFFGWAISADKLIGNPHSGGIVLIDELEQHLHPKWQRQIVQRLSKQFPNTQFIITTHTPLIASGAIDVERSMIVRLTGNENNNISAIVVDKSTISGKQADQVLASEAFGLITTRSPGSEDDLARYAELFSKTRTKEEEQEYQNLSGRLKQQITFGENIFKQSVE